MANEHKASPVMFFKIGKKLGEVLTPLPEVSGQKRCEYADGWSDERVAQEIGVKIASVTGFRRDAYGNIREARKSEDQLEEMVKALQEKDDKAKLAARIHEIVTAGPIGIEVDDLSRRVSIVERILRDLGADLGRPN